MGTKTKILGPTLNIFHILFKFLEIIGKNEKYFQIFENTFFFLLYQPSDAPPPSNPPPPQSLDDQDDEES